MNTSKIIGTILIFASLAVGYVGINKIAENDASVNILGLKINASNESGKTQGFIYLGVAVLLFGGGIYTFNKK